MVVFLLEHDCGMLIKNKENNDIDDFMRELKNGVESRFQEIKIIQNKPDEWLIKLDKSSIKISTVLDRRTKSSIILFF